MCDIDIEYFELKELDKDTFVFTPKELIKDIVWEYSNTYIPFTNGKQYYIYQDIAFKLMEFYEEYYPYVVLVINIVKETDDKLPHILIGKLKSHDKDTILKYSNKIMTDYINKTFSLI
jgi:hypothetical protein